MGILVSAMREGEETRRTGERVRGTSSVVGANLISELINSSGRACESHAKIAFLISMFDILNRESTIAKWKK